VWEFISVLQRTEIESKSQLLAILLFIKNCLYQSCKERKLKANHNGLTSANLPEAFISVLQRTEIESKSQQLISYTISRSRLYQSCKERKLKANHNKHLSRCLKGLVYISLAKNGN